jgi:ATP-binding cassette, subfamily B, bacterial
MRNTQKTNQLPTKLVPFIWHFTQNYRLALLISTIWSIIQGCFFVLISYSIKLIIDSINSYDETKSLINLMAVPSLFFFGIYLLIEIGRVINWNFLDITLSKIKVHMRTSVFKYLQNHSYLYFQNHFSGNVSNKVRSISYYASSILKQICWQIVTPIAQIIFAMIMFIKVHPIINLITAIWFILYMTIVILFSKRLEHYSTETNKVYSNFYGKVVDSIANILSIKSFANEIHEKKNISKYSTEIYNKEVVLIKFNRKIYAIKELLSVIFLCAILFSVIYLKSKSLITTGDVIFVLNANLNLMFDIKWFSETILSFHENIGACKEGLEIITVPHSIVDKPNAEDIKVSKGEIKFQNVSFNYKKEIGIFKNLNVLIKPKEKVGLVGLSGAGKTTFVNLIMRYFDIKNGQILIDNQNIAEVTQSSLRKNIAFIPQDPSLFHRTISENIGYGNIKASKQTILAASKKAYCHNFIKTLPKGYDTLVGERGVKLSGGQKQRIAIARAIIKNAPILILDEATSSLDSLTEKYIQNAIKKLMENRTIVAIAHRLSTLQNMDRILVFDKGKIIQDGSHKQLLAQDGRYKELWNMQVSGFIPEEKEQ